MGRKILVCLFVVGCNLFGCAVPVPDYRLNDKDIFEIVCNRGQTPLGYMNYIFYLDPTHQLAFMQPKTRYTLKNHRETAYIFENYYFNENGITFSAANNEDSMYLNRKSSDLENYEGKVIATSCSSIDSINGHEFFAARMKQVKARWKNIERNIYRQ